MNAVRAPRKISGGSSKFIATIGAIVQCSATPVLVDITNDFNIDVDQIEAAITPRTKGIIPVHLAGWPCDMDPIMNLAREKDLWVVEDCAQANGSSQLRHLEGDKSYPTN